MFIELLTLSLRYDAVLQAYSSADFDWKPWGTGLGVLIVIACIIFVTVNLVREDKDKKTRDMEGTFSGTAEIKESTAAVETKPEPTEEAVAELETVQEPAEPGMLEKPALVETKPEPAEEAVAKFETVQEPAEAGMLEEPVLVETKQEPEVIEKLAEVKFFKMKAIDRSEFTIALDRLEEKPRRVSTGSASLDKLIGGGLVPNKIYLLSGEAGTGKTFIGLQFLHQGLMDGQNGIYVSGDKKHSTFMKEQKFGGWDFSGYVAIQKLGLLDISLYFSELRSGEVGEIDVPALFDDLTQQVNSIKASQIVIDPLVPRIPELVDITGMLKYINNLISFIKNNLSCTVLITTTMNPGSDSLSTYGIEEFLADGVIMLKLAEMGSRMVHTLSVKKMPSACIDLSDHIVEILPNGAIVIKE